MPARLTHEFVKAQFEAKGYQLLSKEYKNNRTKLSACCPNGHELLCSWDKFKEGKKCEFCNPKSHIERYVHLKHDFAFVKSVFVSNGYQLIDNQYKNNHAKLKVCCPRQHLYKVSFANFQSGRRCPSCMKYGYSPSLPGVFYYVRFDVPGMPPLYKVGVTNKSARERLRSDAKHCVVLLEKHYEDGKIPLQKERDVLTRFAEWRYKGKPVLKENGNTELFARDVLMLDTQRLLVS